MVTERQLQERSERQARIRAGALKVFKSKGLENATMDEIAREAGFGKATLYYYFGSREEIFSSILCEGWKNIWESVEAEIQAKNGPKRTFIRLLKTVGSLVETNRALYEFLFNAPYIMGSVPAEKQGWKTYQSRMYGVLTGLLDDGMEKGEFPKVDSRLLMKGLGGLFHGIFFLGRHEEPLTEEQISEFLSEFFGGIGSSSESQLAG